MSPPPPEDVTIGLAQDISDICGALVRRTAGVYGSSARSQVLNRLATGPQLAVRALADAAGVSHQAMSKTVAALRADNLVAVSVDPADRRRKLVRLTPKGADQQKELTATPTLMWLAGLLADLDDEQRGRLHSAIPALRRLVTNPYMNLP
jgi:DNA-binding MarR family transcriptional regulator